LNFGQTIWDKIEVLVGTSSETTWELEEPQENMLKTCWEQGRKTKKNSPHPTPKWRKQAHHECTLNLPIGYMKFLFLRLLCALAKLAIIYKKI
jgi:hypothetical protein